MCGWIRHWLRPARRVVDRPVNDNIYHCTVQKSASQWLRVLFSDPRTHRYSGLTTVEGEGQHADGRDRPSIADRSHLRAFPPRTIVTPLYIDYGGFESIPKPPRYRAFFVMRDPRDVVVSWFFSLKHSHAALGDVERVRQDLLKLSDQDGLLYAIDFLQQYGLFAAQRSWAAANDPHLLLTRFEELTGPDGLVAVGQLFAHCDIPMPADVLSELLDAHRFDKIAGRPRGIEDRAAHYRKGLAGDWRNHFNDALRARFDEAAGDVLASWGYD